jgi:hypothetical protein
VFRRRTEDVRVGELEGKRGRGREELGLTLRSGKRRSRSALEEKKEGEEATTTVRSHC